MGIMIEVPENLGLSDEELKMLFAAKLFDQGLITSGQGADMVGIPKRDFILQLGKYQVSIFQYDEDELLEDIKNARRASNL